MPASKSLKDAELGPRYELRRELGRGGMGCVYLARDHYLGRDVALKLLHDAPLATEELEQIRREFTLLAELDHPGIARAHDFGLAQGRPFFTSELISGTSLGNIDVLDDVRTLLEVATDLAEAMAFLHRSEILHLDIKPSNVLLRDASSTPRAVLIDFGLCRRNVGTGRDAKLKGSLPYMAPEYFGQGQLGPWTDVYALGVTLYRLATGRFPRPGAVAAVRARSKADPLADERAWHPAPDPPSQIRPSLPPDLDLVLLRCLALDPEARSTDLPELLACVRHAVSPLTVSRARPQGQTLTVGRRAELAVADRYLKALSPEERNSKDRPPTGVLVTGSEGMGQSHFLREVKLRAQMRGVPSYLETGYPERPGAPGSIFRCLSVHFRRDAPEARSRWEAFLGRLRRPRRPSRNDTPEAERRLRRTAELKLAVAALAEPLVLVVDGLQFCDEISIGLMVDLVRLMSLSDLSGPGVGLVLGYREEGPALPLLRELTDHFSAGHGHVITLGPLDVDETLELYRRRSGAGGVAGGADETSTSTDAPPLGALGLFQETGGVPARVIRLVGTGASTTQATSHSPGSPPPRSPETDRDLRLDGRERDLLLAISLFGRPATAAELSRTLGAGRTTVTRDLSRLQSGGLVDEEFGRPGRRSWRTNAAAECVLQRVAPSRKRSLHRKIAEAIRHGAASSGDTRLVEAVGHFRLGEHSSAIVKYGIPAARYLASTFQDRAALEILRHVLEAVPARHRAARVDVALEMVESHVRVGNLDPGIEILRELLARSQGLSGARRLRVLLGLATLYSRRGDFKRAAALFIEGLPDLRAPPAGLKREEFLYYLHEYAAMRAFTGEYEDTLRLCDEGLRLAGRRRSFRIREVTLNIHATRANVALRTFDFDTAVAEFEKALEIAESIGSPINRAVVLNNLGIVHIQCDRYTDAIRTFREAERTCLHLDEGPSLVSIHGNLAVLHARRGEFETMDHALAEAERLSPGKIGQRQEFFLAHARGLCLVYRGRYREAQSCLEEAIALGDSMGDRHIACFDRVYLAEALLFQGRYAEARGALTELAETATAIRARRMALARLALLRALTSAGARAVSAIVERYETLPHDRPVPLLDAWDRLFLAWASSIAGSHARLHALLDSAESFFLAHDLRPALSLARWIRAESCLLRDDERATYAAVESIGADASDLTAVLRPLLEARLLLAADDETLRSSGADRLAEAGARLVGNPLPEWTARLTQLRSALQPGARRARAEVERQREALASQLPGEDRDAYLRSDHWRTWTLSGHRTRRLKVTSADREGEPSQAEQRTKTIDRRLRSDGPTRASLVARSPAMRTLIQTLGRLRTVDLPVLVTGETGSGKDLIARVLHEESQRAGAPFRVVNCAAMPRELFEAELFGARTGAFTGLDENRDGILKEAAGGTVLVDEIGEAPLDVQAKLLRVIGNGSFRPLGAEGEEKADVRFLFATAQDLEEAVREGSFREDLYHRINVFSVRVPALRQRPEDLPELVRLLLEEESVGDTRPVVDEEALHVLRGKPWPGNVRQLRNLLLRLRIENPERIDVESLRRSPGERHTTSIFPPSLLDRETLPSLKDRLERDYIVYHFRRLEGSTTRLCEFLELGRRQLYRRCERLGISLRAERRRR